MHFYSGDSVKLSRRKVSLSSSFVKSSLMAANMEEDTGGTRNCKRKSSMNHLKLSLGEKVEVRSMEEGFLGSWHSGRVVSCDYQVRRVEYDNIVYDDDSGQKLVESVKVNPAVNGSDSAIPCPHNYRGAIRPSPPHFDFDLRNLRYGQCVDVYYNDAFWEGVVFDKNDGSENRSIIFPDIGDVMLVPIFSIRISQDWDELNDKWKVRANWLLLELVEEIRAEWPLHVSLMEIWYQIRSKKSFMYLKEWTSTMIDLWKEVVFEVISDFQSLALKHFLKMIDSDAYDDDEDDEKEMKPDTDLALIEGDSDESKLSPYPDPDPVPDPVPNPNALDIVSIDCINQQQQPLTVQDNGWISTAGTDFVPVIKYDPDAVSEYISSEGVGGKRSADLMVRLRQHLASLGWNLDYRLESRREGGKDMIRMRYTNPQGKVFMSLVTACRSLLPPLPEIGPPVPSHNESKSPNSPPVAEKIDESLQLTVVNPLTSNDDEAVSYGSEYNSAAVLEYISIAENKSENPNWYRSPFIKIVQMKARMHLAFVGWKFWYTKRKKRELRYRSSKGRIHMSLIAACKQCVKDGDTAPKTELKKRNGSKSKKNVQASSSTILRTTEEKTSSRKRDSGHLISKTVRQDNPSTSSCSDSQTVISWLIDNNVVLSWAKVFYISKFDNLQLAEGRITRDGIHCVCCGDIFSLTKFEAHAGSTNHRPAANIFLEDGRSLLQCQSQLRSQIKLEPYMKKSKEIVSADISCDKINDSICSVCRLDGELILCDRCPSSYHISCLGLQDVPDGDWFCPSCCCGSCGRIQLSEDANGLNNDSFIHCDQCQHNYHIECLKERAHANPGNIPMENCFCSKRCEDIYLGLASRLGKCVRVGPVKDELTWTLWKGVCSIDGRDQEAESYSKLNVALNVMHECFEPFKDPDTGRDLVEDVIFCQRSELNRLNFEGFFTVILEENDELVSVATVRIHGEKVAELPLVATRFKYRRSGKCRILINELEKMLVELGIQRLVLPAIPSVLNTWKNAFGFSEMSESDKLMYLNSTFLDFEGTVMCQKVLLRDDSISLFPPSENMTELAPGRNVMHLGANKTILENSNDNHVEENRIMEEISSPYSCITRQDVSPDVTSVELGVQFDAFVKFYKRRYRHDNTKDMQGLTDTTYSCYHSS